QSPGVFFQERDIVEQGRQQKNHRWERKQIRTQQHFATIGLNDEKGKWREGQQNNRRILVTSTPTEKSTYESTTPYKDAHIDPKASDKGMLGISSNTACDILRKGGEKMKSSECLTHMPCKIRLGHQQDPGRSHDNHQ